MHYVFGDCVLDPGRRELSRGPEVVALGPKVFDLLLYLLAHRSRVVGKDELLDEVWQGRIVSESTLSSHVNAARNAIGDSGKTQHLLRTVARKGFRFVGVVTMVATDDSADSARAGVAASASASAPESTFEFISGYAAGNSPALALPDKPSIAVLPFLNLSGDPEQDYLIDGVVEDILSALSRIRWLFVIARNSSFTYKGRAVDVRQVGRELGVRYVLEGSIRKSAKRARITGQLIDARSGGHIWAERFEGSLRDIFELQDQVTASVVGAIARQLEVAEIERSKRKPTESLDAYDYYLRGRANLNLGTRDAVGLALTQFTKAIALDPEYAAAYASAAWCHFWRKINGWLIDQARESDEATRLARRAVELGRDDAVALTRGGHALAHFTGDLSMGLALLDRALGLDPNLAAAWFLGGFLRSELGDHEGAIHHLTRAMRFSPLDPEMFRMQAGMALAHLLARRFDDAVAWAERACRELPSFLLAVGLAAASQALAGRDSDARKSIAKLRQLDPSFRLGGLAHWLPLHRPADQATFAEGLRRAGLPD